MGLGDWLIASAQVKEANERTGKKVLLGDGHRSFFEPQVFLNNPRMAQSEQDCVWVANYGGSRPYIKGSKDKRFIFNDDFRPSPGEIYFSDKEELAAPEGDYIVIEPCFKDQFVHTVNKSWPTEYWKVVAKEPLPFLQLGRTETPLFNHLRTDTFRQALYILSKAKLFVGTDGALHHAAAALGIPAVVIWTGFTSPKHLGYDSHRNIHDGGDPCGNYSGVCGHCLEIARSIRPETVTEVIHEEYTRSMATRP